jgi:ribosomal protein L7/L12
MLVTRKNIILATLKIRDMDISQKQEVILKLLETNPTIVLRALEISAVQKLFKVVVTDRGYDKLTLIKCFREIRGAGLADAKAWSEGQPFMEWPSGVFGFDMTRFQADKLLNTITSNYLYKNFKVEIVDNDAKIEPLPVVWNPGMGY